MIYLFGRTAFLLGVLFFSVTSDALIVKLSDLHTMAKRSDVVIHGFVGEQNVETDDLGRLITLTEIEVIEGLHGAKTGEIITVYQVGGQKNGVVMPLLGGQSYNVGQEIFFFGLKIDNAFVSYGAGQGKLDINREGGQDSVVEDLGDISALNGARSHASVSRPSPLTFSSAQIFKDEIKLMLRHP